MSRWLNSVNNLLEKLDDQVDISDAAAFTQRMALRAKRRLTDGGGDDDDDDYDDYEDDDLSEEDDEEHSYDGSDEAAFESDDDEDDDEIEMDLHADDDDPPARPLRRSVTNNPENPTATPSIQYEQVGGGPAPFTPVNQIFREYASELITPPREGMSPMETNAKQPPELPIPPPQEKPAAPNTGSDKSAAGLDPVVKSVGDRKLAPKSDEHCKDSAHPATILPPNRTVPQPKSGPLQSPPSSSGGVSRNNRSNKMEVQRLQQQCSKLEQKNSQLHDDLKIAREELLAQHDELQQAADRMEEERKRQKEELDEVLEEQEEELQQQKSHYEDMLREQKRHYEGELEKIRNRLKAEEQQRLQEGGDWTKDLEDALQRERDALKALSTLKSEKQEADAKAAKVQSERDALQTKVADLKEAVKDLTQREKNAEEKLDLETTQHKRQLKLKIDREADLERTVAELGAALTVAKRQTPAPVPQTQTVDSAHQATVEELETTKTQLSLADEQVTALQRELQEISQERSTEIAAAQTRQRSDDQKIASLAYQVQRLEAALRNTSGDRAVADDPNSQSEDPPSSHKLKQLARDLEKAKRQLVTTTDQCMEAKRSADTSRAEILALKGRLQSATERAERAENALASQTVPPTSRTLEMGGTVYGTSQRRRVRRARGRFSSLPSRSMLSFLGLQITPGSVAEQIAVTIDALDTWMLETGSIMGHEPLARLGFACYLALVHLWCFGLVFLHTVQSEHADLGTLTAHRGPKGNT